MNYCPLSSLSLFHFQFLDHTIVNDHVEYTISILNPENGQTFFLRSRYSSLLDLHKALQKTHPSMYFPSFPPKRCCGNLQEPFINQRKAALERYFNELFIEKLFFQDKAVEDFLQKNQVQYEVAMTKLEETPNTEQNTSDLQAKLQLNQSRSSFNPPQRNPSYVRFRKSSSLKLEDLKKSPIFGSPSSQTKIQNLSSSHDDFKLAEEMFPLDFFEWMNGILELQGLLTENQLSFSLDEEKWLKKIKIKGILHGNSFLEDAYLGFCNEKKDWFEIKRFECDKDDSCNSLGAAVKQLCIARYLAENREIINYQKCMYKEHFEKKTGKVYCYLVILKEIPSLKYQSFLLDRLVHENIGEKKLLFVFSSIFRILELLIKSNVLIKKLSLCDFIYDTECQNIMLISLENCDYQKEGISDAEKSETMKKAVYLLIQLKFNYKESQAEALEKKIEQLRNSPLIENEPLSSKIIKRVVQSETIGISDVLVEFLNKSKSKRKRSLEFEGEKIVLRKDRLKLAQLYIMMGNNAHAIKHLKKLGKEELDHVEYSLLSKNEIQAKVNLRLFILKTLKQSDYNALFYEDYLFKTLNIQKEHLSSNSGSFYIIIKKICNFYISIQDYHKSIDVLTQEIFTENLEPNYQFQIDFNRILSICYRELDDSKLAFFFIDKAMQIIENEEFCSKMNVKKADLIKEKALIFVRSNQPEQIKEGIKFLSKAMSIYEKTYENSEIDLANTKELIGNCWMKIDEYSLAVQALEEAWAIKKSISFIVSQNFENLLLNLAKCHYGLRDLNKASSFVNQTISLIKERKANAEITLSEEKNLMHIEADLRVLKADLSLDCEKLASAKNNFRKALKLYKKVMGKSNIILGELYESYGKVNIRLKDIEKGKKCFLRSLTIYRLNMGESDMKTLAVAETIADLDFQLEEYEDCLLSYQELIDIYKDKWPKKKEEISDFLIRMGNINFKMNQYQEAIENFKEAGLILLEMQKKKEGNPEKVSKIKSKLANIQKDLLMIEDKL